MEALAGETIILLFLAPINIQDFLSERNAIKQNAFNNSEPMVKSAVDIYMIQMCITAETLDQAWVPPVIEAN